MKAYKNKNSYLDALILRARRRNQARRIKEELKALFVLGGLVLVFVLVFGLLY